MKSVIFTLVLLGAFLALDAKMTDRFPRWHQLEGYTFERYVSEHGKNYNKEEFKLRKVLFEKELQLVRAHNADPSQTYKKGINHLSDWTEKEFSFTLGYDKATGYAYKDALLASQKREETKPISIKNLPKQVDWRLKGVVSDVKDQGRCGSCWTFGAAETLESHYAIATGHLSDLSQQQILDCVPNPYSCGGTGGCFGGTAQLAWDTLMNQDSKGLATEWTYPYRSYLGSAQSCSYNSSTTPTFAKLRGTLTLPTNSYADVLNAVATVGPLAINVDASSWRNYETGVFNGCDQVSPDINHVVQLVGYGVDQNHGPYWTVRNSWSPLFGERGYIRLYRSSIDLQCGLDTKPLDGTGCKGGPSKQKVCGACGVLFDVSYPIV